MAAASANYPAPNAIPATAATTDTATPAGDPAATVIVAVSLHFKIYHTKKHVHARRKIQFGARIMPSTLQVGSLA